MIITNVTVIGKQKMKVWEKVYRWKKSLTQYFSIETSISVRRKTYRQENIDEENTWLGIG
jgi:5-bromo-4-chloroindolyl phosphate hydrolysis protein